MSDGTIVRSEMVEFLYRELVGPDPGFPAMQLDREEILRPQDPPRLRYSAGVLFPKKPYREQGLSEMVKDRLEATEGLQGETHTPSALSGLAKFAEGLPNAAGAGLTITEMHIGPDGLRLRGSVARAAKEPTAHVAQIEAGLRRIGHFGQIVAESTVNGDRVVFALSARLVDRDKP